MSSPWFQRLRRWLPWALLLPPVGIAAALLVAWSGVINIAATAGHPVWLEHFLALAMRSSVRANSGAVVVPPLAEDMLPLGAAHFHGNCAICHGAPGQPVNPTFAHMLPTPPPLQEEADNWRTRELFWIGYHGLQYTGMPAWSGAGRNDEVWAVVALLRELPAMEVSTYQGYAAGNTPLNTPPVDQLVREGTPIFPIATCDRCHGTADSPAVSPYVPRLGGQSRAYLLRALGEYRDDHRQSGFMEPVVAALPESSLGDLADYYAALMEPSRGYDPAGEPELGRRLAEEGDPARDLPPCLACHGEPKRADVPHLAGQSARYLKQQLLLWRAGGRGETAHGRLMARIAQRLSPAQIDAVSAYFAGVEAPQGLLAQRKGL